MCPSPFHPFSLANQTRRTASLFSSMKSLSWSYFATISHCCSSSWKVMSFYLCCYCARMVHFMCSTIYSCHRDLLFRLNAFFVYFIYFLSISLFGYGMLKALKPRTEYIPRDLDLFFTTVSAATVSSMSVVEMEVFSNGQLLVITVLMFVGGEVFTSMVRLYFKKSKIIRTWKSEGRVSSVESYPGSPAAHPENSFDQIDEMAVVVEPEPGLTRFESQHNVLGSINPFIKYDSVRFLAFVVLGYLLVIHILGIASVLLYLTVVSSAEKVLRQKGIKTLTFAIFTVVSTFASCGFVPTNENMMVFTKNSGLLWILIPQILSGNTLFPSCLRLLIWVLGKKVKKAEAEYLLKNTEEAGYLHLLPTLHSVLLLATVFGFILIGFVIFCIMEWNSTGLSGLSPYQKIVGVIFQCVNARHTGETIIDLSTVAPTILVFFVVMMYLPPYTSFLPIKRNQDNLLEFEGIKKKQTKVAENIIFSHLSYLAIFVMVICITERKNLKNDPINFSVLNIIVEVISAYGNVGFSTGYSCERQIRPDPMCVDKWYGFSGKWSDEGKVVLIIVMFYGRLKQFNMDGGRGWKLL